MNVFIDAVVDEIIPEKLLPFWDDIKNEYFELSQVKSFSATHILLGKIVYLQNKLSAIQQIVDMMRRFKDDSLTDRLRYYGFDFSFSDESYQQDLDGVIIQSQSESLELEQMEDRWKEMNKEKDGTKATRDYFGSWFDVISDEAGRTISPEQIFVAEYCRRVNNVVQRMEREKSKAAQKRNAK